MHASGRQEVSEREEEPPCYVELGMRKEGDRRLASVYKPEQRAKLQVILTTLRSSMSLKRCVRRSLATTSPLQGKVSTIHILSGKFVGSYQEEAAASVAGSNVTAH